MSEIIAALLGALAVGGLQTIFAFTDRRRMRKSTLMAIAAEVQIICTLIRHQRYLEGFKEALEEIEARQWQGGSLTMDIRSHYFSVFESNTPNLGTLETDHIVKIVRFYGYCKSAIDCTRPDGPFAGGVTADEAEGNIRSVVAILENILRLGDAIIQLPESPTLTGVALP